MAIGTPNFQTGGRSPIELAFRLDRRRRARERREEREKGFLEGVNPLQMALRAQGAPGQQGPLGLGKIAKVLTVGGGGVTQPGRGGLPFGGTVNAGSQPQILG